MKLKNCPKCNSTPDVTDGGLVYCSFCDNERFLELTYLPAEWNARQDAAPQPAPDPKEIDWDKLYSLLERWVSIAERQTVIVESIETILADAMTETTNLTEQDEPTALHMGEALAMGVSICTGGDITRRQLDIRTASRMQMGTDL